LDAVGYSKDPVDPLPPISVVRYEPHDEWTRGWTVHVCSAYIC
jgi:hypothetical protein